MKNKILTLLLLLLFSNLSAQNNILDSLKTKVETSEGTEKIDALNELTKSTIPLSFEKAFLLYQQAITTAEKENYPKGMVEAIRNYASISYRQGKLDSAIILCKKGAAIAVENDLKQWSAKLFSSLATLTKMKGDAVSAKQYNDKCREIAYEIRDTLLIIRTLEQDGISYREKTELDSALSYFLQVRKLATLANNKVYIRRSLTTIASIYFDHKKFLKAREMFLEAYSFLNNKSEKTRADFNELTMVLQNIGATYVETDEFTEALKYLERGLNLSQEKGIKHNEVAILRAIGYAYTDMKEYQKTIKYNNKALALAKELGLDTELGLIYESICSNNMELKRYKKAIQAGEKALPYFTDSEQNSNLERLYSRLSVSYAGLGNFRKAYETKTKQLEYDKLFLDEEKSKQLTEMETKYETEKKEAEIGNLAQENKIQKLESEKFELITFLSGLGVALLLIILGILYNQKQEKEKVRKMETKLEADKQLFKAEITAIKAQMNPHFVFNALNSIQDLIMLKDIRNSNIYLGRFADLMRKTLDFSSRPTISLTEEKEMLEVYLSLEKLRFGDDFTSEITINFDEYDAEKMQIPSMLLQPYVENAVKHGLLHKKGEKKLTVSFQKTDNKLLCEITDNGVGREKTTKINERKVKYHQSFASDANEKRIALINETSSQHISLNIIDLYEGEIPTGTKVVLEIKS